jgi:hypothetical protein
MDFWGFLMPRQGVEGADGVADHGDGRSDVPHNEEFCR